MRIHALLFLSLCFCGVLPAQVPEADEEGCKDSKLINRMPGCKITQCSVKDFDSVELQIGPLKEDGAPTRNLEGQVEILSYSCPRNLSLLQIARNAESAMKTAGFRIVFSGKAGDGPLVTGQKGEQWLEVKAEPINDDPFYRQTAVLVKQMAQNLEADAGAWAEEINKSGRVAVYGITFDIGKAALKPESDAILDEIAKLMSANPGWKLRIEGHTDNVGAKAANQTLSEQRAAAVVAWLVSHGVAKARLASQGFGDSKPAADNTSDDGRAKNRRVELAKF